MFMRQALEADGLSPSSVHTGRYCWARQRLPLEKVSKGRPWSSKIWVIRGENSHFWGRNFRLNVRKGHKRSIVALGHKMLRTIYAMLSKYVDKSVDYEALMVARNAPRWLQMLVKHGFVPTPA